MEEKDFSLESIDREKIKTSVRLHTPIEITSYTLPKNMEFYIYEVISEFLKECHQEHMTDYLKFSVGELLNNAKKANTKRVYFTEKKLDINNDDDYNEGMLFFKDETLMNIDHYLEEQKKAGLYIKLILRVTDEYITIEIKNNCALTKFESQRIDEKIKLAQQYDGIDDVFTKVLDQTEGAGLGIIIIILMLQKIGLSINNYQVVSKDGETSTKIELPINELMQNDLETIGDIFAETQDDLPVLEKSFKEIRETLDKAETTVSEALNAIVNDVSLSFLIVSEASKIDKSVNSITQAVNILGMDKINSIISEDNPAIRFFSQEEDPKNLWKHSYDVAFFAYNLVKNITLDKDLSPDMVYACALFHDFECILLETDTENHRNKIEDLCEEYSVNPENIKLFYEEKGHGKGGGAFAEKWGLNPCFVESIKYHNDPARANPDIELLVNYVYFADILQYYMIGKVEYSQINKKTLELFGIESETNLKFIIDQIKSVM